jgi:hypothetical protein
MRTLEQHESECQVYQSLFSEILLELTERKLPLRAKFGTFAPHLQFITLDALKPKDYPHNIADNSIYVMFKVNFKEGVIETSQSGHIYLTDADQKASYLCMCSMKNAAKAVGNKWFRKTKFKTPEELADKLEKFWGVVMDTLDKATNGYPYKQMKISIYC